MWRQLVGQHALELDAVHLLQQAGGDGDGRVLRVAAGGEGVGAGVVDDVDPRLRQPAGDAQALDEVVAAARTRVGSAGLGPAHGQGDRVGLPVATTNASAPAMTITATTDAAASRA